MATSIYSLKLIVATALTAMVVASCAGSNDSGGDSDASVDAPGGKVLAERLGCVNCHSADGSKRVGPTWQGLAGSAVTLRDGTIVSASRSYLSESIREPSAKVVAGFSALMPQISMSVEDTAALVAYIESLGGPSS